MTSSRASRARARWGRLGLLIHSTAGFIDPGWDGHVTLELSNVANLPITLYVGMKIGQLSFVQLTGAGREPLRGRAARLEVPGPGGPTPEPLLEEFRVTVLVVGGHRVRRRPRRPRVPRRGRAGPRSGRGA
jgi:hypothetical protein